MPGRVLLPALGVCAAMACSGSELLGPTASPSDEVAAAEERHPPTPGKRYTLVLGNSLAFGSQPTGDVFDPMTFTNGFGTLFVSRLNAIRWQPRVTEINLACPGESTETFVVGGCIYTEFGLPLHRPYSGPQLEAAEDFLRHHRGRVNPIILSLGANELYQPYLFECAREIACVVKRIPAAIDAVTRNYDIILRRLRALEPNATLLILVEYRFPTFPRRFNDGLTALYRRVRVAGRAYGATLVESDPIIRAHPCRLLFICDPEPDVHPTDAGYRALADALWDAGGFGCRRNPDFAKDSRRADCPGRTEGGQRISSR